MGEAPLVHILGAGPWQLPTIRRAKELGYRVLVTDMAENRPGYALADVHERANLIDFEETLAVAKRHRIDGIVCDTTDAGVLTAAQVAEVLGLPGIGAEVARRFTDKALMRQMCLEAGIPQPPFARVTNDEELAAALQSLRPPLIMKPLDSMAGAGVLRIARVEEAQAALAYATEHSRSGAAVVEQALEGTESTVEGCVVNGEVHILAISDKEHFAHCGTVAQRICFPAALAPDERAAVEAMHRRVVKALGLDNGLTHAEYFVNGDDATLIEIAARGGGSEIFTHAVPAHCGVDLVTANLQFSLGKPFPKPEPRGQKPAVHIEFLSFGTGTVREVSGLAQARASEGVNSVFFDIAAGTDLPAIKNDRHRRAHVVATGSDREQARERAQASAAHLCVRF